MVCSKEMGKVTLLVCHLCFAVHARRLFSAWPAFLLLYVIPLSNAHLLIALERFIKVLQCSAVIGSALELFHLYAENQTQKISICKYY